MNQLRKGVVIFKSSVLTLQEILCGIVNAAKNGRTLPRLTLLLPFQVMAHSKFTNKRWYTTSASLLYTNFMLNIVGYIFLILLYRHSVQVIFNRKIPTCHNVNKVCAHPAITSFNTHLLMLHPLEILFRFMTAPFRVLPDIIVLGEVRCGTTNLCAHLSSLSVAKHSGNMKIKCYTPFCPWAHPELDNKESFYFVGHYLGIVDPYFYRMAFPLIITKWWEERIRGNIFFTFDGCAQYLSSPTAPYLIASAYKRNKVPPPILVACIRKPVDQAMSWWQYENNAMLWGESIGLKEWNTELRSKQYPPKTLSEAVEYSQSFTVQQAYEGAESLVVSKLQTRFLLREQQNCARKGKSLLSMKEVQCIVSKHLFTTLPPWAITWPGGQLSIFGKGYSCNIKRYNDVFKSEFGKQWIDTDCQKNPNDNIKIGCIHIVPLESQATGSQLKVLLRRILADVVHNCATRRSLSSVVLMHSVDLALGSLFNNANHSFSSRRNSSLSNTDSLSTVSCNERKALEKLFADDIADMENKLGRSLGWT